MMRLSNLGLLLIAMTSLAFGQEHNRTSFSKEELLETAFTWLSEVETEDTLHIYKLSCPSCIMELKGAFNSGSKRVGAMNFSTFKKEDRPIAQALLATTLSHTDESEQKDVFAQLLQLFVESADQYHTNPKDWLELCLGFWNTNQFDVGDKRIWADALNWLDRQNRINMLMDLTYFPGSLELKAVNPIPPIKQKTYRDQFTLVALALPWLKYPETHPVKGQPTAANHPENLPLLFVNPLRPFPQSEWDKMAKQAGTGTFWNFIGDPDIVLHPRVTEFLAAFLDMPTDAERQKAFAEAITTIGNYRGSQKSFLATLPRVKDSLPSVTPERKETLTAEAQQMMEYFLIYDLFRR